MSDNNGPMVSEKMFDEFIGSYYDVVIPVFKERGVKVIDTGGDFTLMTPWLMRHGADWHEVGHGHEVCDGH